MELAVCEVPLLPRSQIGGVKVVQLLGEPLLTWPDMCGGPAPELHVAPELAATVEKPALAEAEAERQHRGHPQGPR